MLMLDMSFKYAVLTDVSGSFNRTFFKISCHVLLDHLGCYGSKDIALNMFEVLIMVV